MASLVRHVTSAGSPSLLGEGPARFLVQGSPCALAALSSRGWGQSPEECLAGPQSVPKALEATGWPARPADTQEMENFARLGCSHSKAREGLTAGPALPPPAGGRVSHRWDETGESQPGSWEPEEAGGGEATGRRDGSFWSWVWAESWAFGRSPWLELRRAGPGVGGTWAAGVRCGRAVVGCTASPAWLLVFLPRSAARVPTSRAACRPPRGRGVAESRPAGPRAAVLSAGSAPRPRNPCRVAWGSGQRNEATLACDIAHTDTVLLQAAPRVSALNTHPLFSLLRKYARRRKLGQDRKRLRRRRPSPSRSRLPERISPAGEPADPSVAVSAQRRVWRTIALVPTGGGTPRAFRSLPFG